MFLRVFYFLLTLLVFSCTHKYEKKKPAFGKMTITVGGHDKTATINTSEYAEQPFTFAFKRSELEHDHDREGHEHSAMDLVMNFTSESPISDAYIDIHPLGEEMHPGHGGHVSGGGAHNMEGTFGFTGRMTLGNTGTEGAAQEWEKPNGSFSTKGITQLILSKRKFPTTEKMPDFGGTDKKYKVEIGMTNQDGAAVSFAFTLHVLD